MDKYRAGVIGLGWMGMLYDLAQRLPDRFSVDDVDRPTPEVDPHRRIHHWEHPGNEGLPSTYAEALWDRPEVELVAAADRDEKRLKIFSERYDVKNLYTDAEEMLRGEKLDIVAVATNTKGRADLTCLAVECGARGIMTEKPMAHTLDEADRMVQTCAKADVPLCCGSITTTHPSFGKAKELVRSGAIGEIIGMEAAGPGAQHQNWSYFLNSAPAWVVGIGDAPRQESGSDEFMGQGILVTVEDQMLHFRKGAPGIRLSGTKGEIVFGYEPGWRLWQEVDTLSGQKHVEMPWPDPQFRPPYGAVYGYADIFDCLAGKLDEPKNSGRRVAVALEVEIALKVSSARGGTRVELPLEDRSLRLNYAWFR